MILCCGAAGRLGLPSSGYLMGTYENPTNAGDGYAMAYHAGAELANLECFQINPLIKDYNGPACAYVTGPLGGYTANARGERFIECDYWSGQMMWEFHQELEGGNGPVFLKLDHLAEETIQTIEDILHGNERPSRGQFHAGRGTDYRQQMVEMHISEIGFCPATGLRRVGQREGRDQREGPLRRRRHGRGATQLHARRLHLWLVRRAQRRRIRRRRAFSAADSAQVERERARIALLREHGLSAAQVDKLRRLVNDYLQPPKVTRKMELGLQRIQAIAEDLERIKADNPHELMRAPGGQRDPRLRGDGRARLAVPHREPLGPVPPPGGLSAARRRCLVLPRAPEEGRTGTHGQLQETGRTLPVRHRRGRTAGLPAPAAENDAA